MPEKLQDFLAFGVLSKDNLTFVHEPRKLPLVLSHEEVARLLEAAPGVKYKAALSAAYTVAGFTGARWISRISPWCTLATGPLSQAIVAASQLISVILPPSAASPRQ